MGEDPAFPAAACLHTGRPRADDRKVLCGILHVLRTGCRWKDMPREHGSYVTAWRRLRRWQEEAVWTGIWQAFLASLDEQGKLMWTRAFLDGSFVPAKKGEKKSGPRRWARGRSGCW